MFVATTISFNLAPGKALGDATKAIDDAVRQIGMPASIHGSFAGTAQTFQQSLNSEPVLIAAALVAVYIVLGVLYESYMHPITILSTLPSAGVGAVLALLVFGTPFTIIALIGVILLIGIVKKNAIMMIDFALDAERTHNMDPRDAIFEACRLRFRPIMMTTMAAMLGALPLALSFGTGGELRRPLGISIVGGLMLSQVLTLYTTPVVYLYLDRFRLAAGRRWRQAVPRLSEPPRGRRNERGSVRLVPAAWGSAAPAVWGSAAAPCAAQPRLPYAAVLRLPCGVGLRVQRGVWRSRLAALLPVLALSACMVGPDYHRPIRAGAGCL